MSTSPKSGARGLQRLPSMKYYSAQKWESRLTPGLDAAKNTYYMKKKLQIKVIEH